MAVAAGNARSSLAVLCSVLPMRLLLCVTVLRVLAAPALYASASVPSAALTRGGDGIEVRWTLTSPDSRSTTLPGALPAPLGYALAYGIAGQAEEDGLWTDIPPVSGLPAFRLQTREVLLLSTRTSPGGVISEGTFRLQVRVTGGARQGASAAFTTEPLQYNSSAEEIGTALNSLSPRALGGAVDVTRTGPGPAGADYTWAITFAAAQGEEDTAAIPPAVRVVDHTFPAGLMVDGSPPVTVSVGTPSLLRPSWDGRGPTGPRVCDSADPATPCTHRVVGLLPGVPYVFRVQALYSPVAGGGRGTVYSAWSPPSTPLSLPAPLGERGAQARGEAPRPVQVTETTVLLELSAPVNSASALDSAHPPTLLFQLQAGSGDGAWTQVHGRAGEGRVTARGEGSSAGMTVTRTVTLSSLTPGRAYVFRCRTLAVGGAAGGGGLGQGEGAGADTLLLYSAQWSEASVTVWTLPDISSMSPLPVLLPLTPQSVTATSLTLSWATPPLTTLPSPGPASASSPHALRTLGYGLEVKVGAGSEWRAYAPPAGGSRSMRDLLVRAAGVGWEGGEWRVQCREEEGEEGAGGGNWTVPPPSAVSEQALAAASALDAYLAQGLLPPSSITLPSPLLPSPLLHPMHPMATCQHSLTLGGLPPATPVQVRVRAWSVVRTSTARMADSAGKDVRQGAPGGPGEGDEDDPAPLPLLLAQAALYEGTREGGPLPPPSPGPWSTMLRPVRTRRLATAPPSSPSTSSSSSSASAGAPPHAEGDTHSYPPLLLPTCTVRTEVEGSQVRVLSGRGALPGSPAHPLLPGGGGVAGGGGVGQGGRTVRATGEVGPPGSTRTLWQLDDGQAGMVVLEFLPSLTATAGVTMPRTSTVAVGRGAWLDPPPPAHVTYVRMQEGEPAPAIVLIPAGTAAVRVSAWGGGGGCGASMDRGGGADNGTQAWVPGGGNGSGSGAMADGEGGNLTCVQGGGAAHVSATLQLPSPPPSALAVVVGEGGRAGDGGTGGAGGWPGGARGGSGRKAGGGGGGFSAVYPAPTTHAPLASLLLGLELAEGEERRPLATPWLLAAGGGGGGASDYCCSQGGAGGGCQGEAGGSPTLTPTLPSPLPLPSTALGLRPGPGGPWDPLLPPGSPPFPAHLDGGTAGENWDGTVLATGGAGGGGGRPGGRAGGTAGRQGSLPGEQGAGSVLPQAGGWGKGGAGGHGWEGGGGGGAGLWGGAGGGGGIDGGGGGGGASYVHGPLLPQPSLHAPPPAPTVLAAGPTSLLLAWPQQGAGYTVEARVGEGFGEGGPWRTVWRGDGREGEGEGTLARLAGLLLADPPPPASSLALVTGLQAGRHYSLRLAPPPPHAGEQAQAQAQAQARTQGVGGPGQGWTQVHTRGGDGGPPPCRGASLTPLPFLPSHPSALLYGGLQGAGQEGGGEGGGGSAPVYSSDLWQLSLPSGVWSRLPVLDPSHVPAGRERHGAAWAGGHMYVVGGEGEGGGSLHDMWLLDVGADRYRQTCHVGGLAYGPGGMGRVDRQGVRPGHTITLPMHLQEDGQGNRSVAQASPLPWTTVSPTTVPPSSCLASGPAAAVTVWVSALLLGPPPSSCSTATGGGGGVRMHLLVPGRQGYRGAAARGGLSGSVALGSSRIPLVLPSSSSLPCAGEGRGVAAEEARLHATARALQAGPLNVSSALEGVWDVRKAALLHGLAHAGYTAVLEDGPTGGSTGGGGWAPSPAWGAGNGTGAIYRPDAVIYPPGSSPPPPSCEEEEGRGGLPPMPVPVPMLLSGLLPPASPLSPALQGMGSAGTWALEVSYEGEGEGPPLLILAWGLVLSHGPCEGEGVVLPSWARLYPPPSTNYSNLTATPAVRHAAGLPAATPTSPFPPGRASPTLLSYADRWLFLAGGEGRGEGLQYRRELWRYDTHSNGWSQLHPLPGTPAPPLPALSASGHLGRALRAGLLGSGRGKAGVLAAAGLLAVGGDAGVQAWVPGGASEWLPIDSSSAPSPRSLAALTLVPPGGARGGGAGLLLMVGGQEERSGRLVGETWTLSPLPPSTTSHAGQDALPLLGHARVEEVPPPPGLSSLSLPAWLAGRGSREAQRWLQQQGARAGPVQGSMLAAEGGRLGLHGTAWSTACLPWQEPAISPGMGGPASSAFASGPCLAPGHGPANSSSSSSSRTCTLEEVLQAVWCTEGWQGVGTL